MRFRIQFKLLHEARLLPINYLPFVAKWVRKVFDSPSITNDTFPEFQSPFQAYTFGQMYLPGFAIEGDCFRLSGDTVFLQISTLPLPHLEKVLRLALLEQPFIIHNHTGKLEFKATKVDVDQLPFLEEEISYRTISPICLLANNQKLPNRFISPKSNEYADLLLKSVCERPDKAFIEQTLQASLVDLVHQANLNISSPPRSRLLRMEMEAGRIESVKAWHMQFSMQAPSKLHQLLYCIGIGHYTSQGFGCITPA